MPGAAGPVERPDDARVGDPAGGGRPGGLEVACAGVGAAELEHALVSAVGVDDAEAGRRRAGRALVGVALIDHLRAVGRDRGVDVAEALVGVAEPDQAAAVVANRNDSLTVTVRFDPLW